ncbi:MAG: Gfo/Idh/MocA family oxidoreductase [bacterium]
MQTLRCAVIGAGLMGRRHAVELNRHPACNVVAIVDPIEEARLNVADAVGAEAFECIESLLEKTTPDLVVVATPDHLHHQPTMACIEAGVKNLVLEKPIATTIEEGLEIVQAAKRAGSFILINFSNRFWPAERATRLLVHEHFCGEMVSGRLHLDDNIGVPKRLWQDRSAEWVASSSPAHFLFPHLIDLLYFYLPDCRVVSVSAKSVSKAVKSTPDTYMALLEWSSGAITQLEATWIKHIPRLVESFDELVLTEGTITHNRHAAFQLQPGWTAASGRNLSETDLEKLQARFRAMGLQTKRIRFDQEPSEGDATIMPAWSLEQVGSRDLIDMHLYADAVLEYSLTPTSWQDSGPLPSLKDGWEVLRVVAAVLKSAEEKREVAVDDVGPLFEEIG